MNYHQINLNYHQINLKYHQMMTVHGTRTQRMLDASRGQKVLNFGKIWRGKLYNFDYGNQNYPQINLNYPQTNLKNHQINQVTVPDYDDDHIWYQDLADARRISRSKIDTSEKYRQRKNDSSLSALPGICIRVYISIKNWPKNSAKAVSLNNYVYNIFVLSAALDIS